MIEQTLFKRVLNSYNFKNKDEYKKILYHYETMTFDQVKYLLTDSEILHLNFVTKKIFTISSMFIHQFKIHSLHFAFNKCKNFLELMPHINELSILDYEEKRKFDHEYEYNYIILKNSPLKRFEQIRDAIIETMINYDFKLNFETLEVKKNNLLENFIL